MSINKNNIRFSKQILRLSPMEIASKASLEGGSVAVADVAVAAVAVRSLPSPHTYAFWGTIISSTTSWRVLFPLKKL